MAVDRFQGCPSSREILLRVPHDILVGSLMGPLGAIGLSIYRVLGGGGGAPVHLALFCFI